MKTNNALNSEAPRTDSRMARSGRVSSSEKAKGESDIGWGEGVVQDDSIPFALFW
jgi:hypothetical protein